LVAGVVLPQEKKYRRPIITVDYNVFRQNWIHYLAFYIRIL